MQQSGKVKLLECNSTRISAQVQGSESRPYEVWVDARYRYGCNCPSDTQPCKHVAATLLSALEVKNTSETPFNLQNYLDNLEPTKAKTLLLELAQIPSIRLMLLERNTKTLSKAKGAVKTLEKLLERQGDIEDEGELGQAAFEELQEYAPEERKIWAERLLELLENYSYEGYDEERDYDDDYDHEEGGETYWEDQINYWTSDVYRVLGSALHDLSQHDSDQSNAIFEEYLSKLDDHDHIWHLLIKLAQGNTHSIEKLGNWLILAQKHGIHKHDLDEWSQQFYKELGTEAQYLDYMRSRLGGAKSYLELVKVLIERNQLKEALDIAVQGVCNLERLDYVDVGAMALLLELLMQHQPNLEWNEKMFQIRPTFNDYQYLRQNHPQFIRLRAVWLESQHMPLELKIEILHDENDLVALEQILKKRATPDVAAQISPLLPHLCRPIFKKAVLEGISEGQRSGYARGAKWAEEYRKVEDPAVFRVWLLELLKVNIRRSALQDEFGKVRMKLNTP